MPENKTEKKWVPSPSIKALLTLLLYLAIFASFVFVLYTFFLPTAEEYDDPATGIQESFPWRPNIFSDGFRVLRLFSMGFLRHIALLPEHVTTVDLISMVSYIFFTLFIHSIRRTFLTQEELGIPEYVQWGIGAMIGAIIFVAGTTSIRRYPEVAVTSVWFSVACLILYLIHPEVAFISALKKRISGTKETKKEARQKK